MPRNGSGTYAPPSGNPVVTGTVISSTVQNNTVTDLGDEITNSLPRDGQAPMLAALNMGGFKITNADDGVADSDVATVAQTKVANLAYTPPIGSPTTINAYLDGHHEVNLNDAGADSSGGMSSKAAFDTVTGVAYNDRLVHLSHGIYTTTTDIVLYPHQGLIGDSTGGSHTDTDDGVIIRAISGGAFTNALVNMSGHSQLKGLKLDGNAVAASAVLHGDTGSGFKNLIENCRFGGFTQDVIKGTGADSLTVQLCEFNGGATSYGMINLTSASITTIADNRFVPQANCAYIIKLTSALNNSKIAIYGNLLEGSNSGTDVSDYIDGIIVDADDVSIFDNIFQMNPASTVFRSYIRVKNGAQRTYIGRNVFQNAVTGQKKIIIEAGAVDTVIDGSVFGWTSGAGVTADITDNGTNTLIMFPGIVSGRRIYLTPTMTIAAMAGGKQFHFDTSNSTLYFNEAAGTTTFIGAPAGELSLRSAARMIFNAATNHTLQVNSVTCAQIDGSVTAGQTRLLIWDVDNNTLERVTVGAADSGGAGFKVLRIPN